MTTVQFLDFPAFSNTPLITEPFPYLIVPNFIRQENLSLVHQDFPKMKKPGSYPVSLLRYGKNFRDLLAQVRGPELQTAIAEKFGISLAGLPTMVTVRGHSQQRDGRIHTDTKSKIISVLIYLNPSWEEKGGQLRLLRNGNDIEDVITEIPPVEGTLLAFKVSANSWHGHKPFVGQRRVIQLNYVINKAVIRKEVFRHYLSAITKRFKKSSHEY